VIPVKAAEATMTITDFLMARIAEDEAAALHRDVVTCGAERRKFANDALRDTHDPARVLAECAAKRTIVDMHETYASAVHESVGIAWSALDAARK
jgi:hypothetical protein